ncbi:hypothetical protein ACSS6N_22120 [Peribacillus frigoritolerans]|uniref:hypothetical protein n=1 Tax=Peribacillus frigoritolerans TaxID=450367 RepID=UPI003F84E293
MGTLISTPGTRFPRAVREPPRRTCACGVSLGRVFPQESRTFRSNQLCVLKEETVGSSYSKHSLKLAYPSCFFPEILIGWKKFATLLPKYWLAETPETPESRRLGRQSAERERISEISWIFI